SNYGSVVDIFAPGSSITSAWFTSNTAINTISGTSMASPHVAGAAALFLEYASTSTPAQVEAGLKQFGAVGRLSEIPTGTTNNLLQINFGTVPPLPPPGVPTLSSPAANATNVSIAPTLSWLASTAATTYNLQVSTSSTFAVGSFVQDLTGLGTTSRALSGLLNSTVYYWRVSATNSVGTSAWSAIRSFTTVAPPGTPTAPALTSPANNANNVSQTATFSWGTSTNASTYDIEISTVNTFASTVFSRTGLTTLSVAVSPAMAVRITHYWRVRGKNSLGVVGPWSTVRTFRTR
ncbi:MAG: S8 family serine peptidase, partial [Bacteroidota bacterium]